MAFRDGHDPKVMTSGEFGYGVTSLYQHSPFQLIDNMKLNTVILEFFSFGSYISFCAQQGLPLPLATGQKSNSLNRLQRTLLC